MVNFITFSNLNMGIQNKPADFTRVIEELGVNISSKYQASGLADKPSYFKTNHEVFNLVKNFYNTTDKTVCLTEDHSLVSGIFKNLPADSGLVYIDAHTDIHSWRTSISQKPHGMSLGTLMGLEGDELKGNVSPKNLILIGAKDFEKEEFENLINLGVENVFAFRAGKFYNIFTQEEKTTKDIIDLINTVSQRTNAMGMSFDLDGLDKKEFTGAHYKVGNLPMNVCSEILVVLSSLCSLFEITELNTYDTDSNNFKIFKQALTDLSLLKVEEAFSLVA